VRRRRRATGVAWLAGLGGWMVLTALSVTWGIIVVAVLLVMEWIGA